MLVTVVIPMFNVAAYIEEAILSVLTQDYPQVELIVVDNGSTDATIELVEKMQVQYPERIRLLHENSRGAPFARNRGWTESKGEWIQFLDADDYLLPGKLKRQMDMIADTSADVVVGTPVYENLQAQQATLVPWSDPWKGLAHGMYCGQTSANLYRNEALTSIGGWNEQLPDTQDTDLMLSLLISGQETFIDRVASCVCRDRPVGKITQKDPTGILVRHLQLRKRMNKYLVQEKPAYWKENRSFFLMATYRLLRMLAVQDTALAAQLYTQYIPSDFRLIANKELKIPAWNTHLVNWIGIKKAEQLKQKLRVFFSDEGWKSWKERLAAK